MRKDQRCRNGANNWICKLIGLYSPANFWIRLWIGPIFSSFGPACSRIYRLCIDVITHIERFEPKTILSPLTFKDISNPGPPYNPRNHFETLFLKVSWKEKFRVYPKGNTWQNLFRHFWHGLRLLWYGAVIYCGPNFSCNLLWEPNVQHFRFKTVLDQ